VSLMSGRRFGANTSCKEPLPEGPLLMGIDIGTSSSKVSLVASATLQTRTYTTAYPLLTPKPSYVELDPSVVVGQVFELIRGAVSERYSHRIDGIGLCGLVPSLIPVDKSGCPLLNCITYMDKRASLEANWIEQRIGPANLYDIAFRRSMPKFLAPKILWIKRHHRDIYRNTFKFLQIKDLMALRLCGKFCTDPILASNSLVFDLRSGAWARDLIEAMGIDGNRLPDVHPPMSIVGGLTPEASRLTGLREGIPVVCGSTDLSLATLAIGASKSDVAFEMTGTSTVLGIHVLRLIGDQLQRYEVSPGLKPGTFTIAFVNHGTGAILRWLVEGLGRQGGPDDFPADDYRVLEGEAARLEIGADGLIVLPYFEGMGTGLYGRRAKGAIYGLSLRHTAAHVYRAILEAIALRVRENTHVLQALGLEIREVRTTGGVARSELLRQIQADAIGLPFALMTPYEAPSVGAAIAAGGGVGIYEDPFSIGDRVSAVADMAIPRAGATAIYEGLAKRVADLEGRLFG